MARETIAVQTIGRSGLAPAYAAAHADGGAFGNDGRTFLHVKNGATAVVVTIRIPVKVDGQAVTNPAVTVPATQERMIGPFPPGIYNQPGSDIHVDFDDVSNVTVAAVRLP